MSKIADAQVMQELLILAVHHVCRGQMLPYTDELRDRIRREYARLAQQAGYIVQLPEPLVAQHS